MAFAGPHDTDRPGKIAERMLARKRRGAVADMVLRNAHKPCALVHLDVKGPAHIQVLGKDAGGLALDRVRVRPRAQRVGKLQQEGMPRLAGAQRGLGGALRGHVLADLQEAGGLAVWSQKRAHHAVDEDASPSLRRCQRKSGA